MERKTVVIAQSDLERQKAVCEQIREYWLAQGPTPLAFVDTYGCLQNEADSERIRGMLQSCGYQLSDTEEGADCIVINTCAIREHAEDRVFGNLGALTHTKKENPEQTLQFFANLPNFSAVLVIKQAQLVLAHMQELVVESVRLAGDVLTSKEIELKKMERIVEIENICDQIQKEIMIYLDKVMQQEISEADTRSLKMFIVCSDELESISDYAANIVKYRMRLDENNIKLKRESRELLAGIVTQIIEFTQQTSSWLEESTKLELEPIITQYRKLTAMANDVRDQHLEMVQKKQYPPLFALTFSDIMVSLRRIKNHTMNIAEAISGGVANF